MTVGAAILTACRERINGTLTTPAPRKIASGMFSTDMFEGADDFTAQVRALGMRSAGNGSGVIPAVTVTASQTEAPESPSGPSNIAILVLRVVVRAYYDIGVGVELEADFNAIRAQALTDSDLIRQAFLWPGALTQTSAAVATGIVSGILRQSGDARVQRESHDTGGLLVTEAEYEGRVVVTQAVT